MTPMIHHSYNYGPAIHARSHIQNLARTEAGQTITVAGHFTDAFERKGHHYAVVDGVILSENSRELSRLRHTTIFQVARGARRRPDAGVQGRTPSPDQGRPVGAVR